MKKIKDLNNSEISLVFYQFNRHFTEMNEQLSKNMIAEKVNIDMGENGPPITPIIIAVEKVDNDEVAAIRSSHYYQTIKSLVDKLSPIVEMIEEAEPHIKESLDE
jgi:hypothetical protein